MRKFIALITVFFFLLAPILIGVQFPDTYKMVSRATAKVSYIIQNVDIFGKEYGEKCYESCVFFEKRYCFTNAHLVNEMPVGKLIVEVWYQDRPVFLNASVNYWDRKTDLMILKIEEDFLFEPVKLAENYTVGEPIMYGGYGNLPHPKIRFGILNYHPAYGIYLENIYYGDSGSGVFNMKGELLGITYSGYRLPDTGQHTLKGYAFSLEILKDFLSKWRSEIQSNLEMK